jgi:hypothetical protein
MFALGNSVSKLDTHPRKTEILACGLPFSTNYVNPGIANI